MGKKERIKRGITDALALPKEIVLNLPMVHMVGNEEVHVENYKGVLEYTPEKVRINTTKGVLKIEGRKLLLREITSEDVAVMGSILKIEYVV